MDFNLTKEQRDIVRAAREFARGEFPQVALEFDRTESFNLDLWRRACELGFVGVFIPERHGGAGLGFLEHCLINEEFWAVDPGCGQAIMATTFGAELLLLFGSAEQQSRILPHLTSGQAILATAITESGAGSDVTAVATTAVREGDEWVVNGTKMFTTNGTLANYVILYCLTDPENPSRHQRHSFLLAETNRPGYQAVKMTGKLGIRASDTAELALTNLRLPAEALIGAQGQGFNQLMAFFNRTRLHISAQATGLMRACLEDSVKHAKGRIQFGAPLASFQATQMKLAELATHLRAAQNLWREAAWRVDQGQVDHALTAMAKWFSAQAAVRAADEAVQIHGGYGYFDETRVQRLYRDAKILEIYEGAKEVEKLIIARSLVG